MKFVIFEDEKYDKLYPLNILRASFDVKTGVFTNKERLKQYLPSDSNFVLFVRDDLKDFLASVNDEPVNIYPDDDTIFLNGRIVFTMRILQWIQNNMPLNSLIINNDTIVAAKMDKNETSQRKNISSFVLNSDFFAGLKNTNEVGLNLDVLLEEIYYPWDILKSLDLNLGFDLSFLIDKFKNEQKNPDTTQENDNNFVHPSAKVYPGVVLDTVSGEIFIAENAVIEPLCYIKGPVYIGKNCLVKSGTRIYGPCFIGKKSKVCGEISGSIFHSNVNKQHDGFIGNSYSAPFVNYGADTVTSNLKNNYSKIRVNLDGKSIETGMQLLGTIAGDHSKFGINTMLNTGTICGIFANVAGGGFPDKWIDSFSWNIIGKQSSIYRIDEALQTASIVMKRRGYEIKKEYQELVRKFYKNKFKS